MDSLGFPRDKVQLVLNRSNAYTGINVDNAESALGRRIDFQVMNEYRGAISALNSGEPFMSSRPDGPLGANVTKFAQDLDGQLAGEPAMARLTTGG
jgi:MinD-like ATPase involved in chromosome partitioning or flagellar assembly